MQKLPLLLLLTACVATDTTSAKAIKVDSLSALETAISQSTPGADIVLAKGVYTSTNAIRITQQGTAKRPITISAEALGGVENPRCR